MVDLISIAVTSVFISNILLANFLGMCSFLSCSKNIKTATGLGIAVIFVSVLTAPLNWLILKFLLVEDALTWLGPWAKGLNLEVLSLLTFIAVIAAVVQCLEMIIEKYSPSLYASLGIFLPLISVNCAILGINLFFVERKFDLLETIVFSFFSGLGWMLAILGLAAIRKKMIYSNVPKNLQGLGITFIVSGLMSMAFMCFGGIDIKKELNSASAKKTVQIQSEKGGRYNGHYGPRQHCRLFRNHSRPHRLPDPSGEGSTRGRPGQDHHQ
ncbi:MAG: NADH:ubiquinone reductase (Na(+)-transporting) subunit E [Planctomycetes bacterium]|nr:NADH:ubiquinone reductase (Na(+)-transporting) subunit E [Planctomycetota bacterium]